MSDTIKITLIIILGLITLNLIANRSNADEEIAKANEQIAILSGMIEQEKDNYDIALGAKDECEESWLKQMDEAHKKADEHRAEIKKLEGFIQSRQAQK